MDFDKSRVYTALNADELKVGSTVIVANSLQELKDKLNTPDRNYTTSISRILLEAAMRRFETIGRDAYLLAYLISPPKEPKYKPFSDTETAFKIITAHGGWVKNSNGEYLYVTSINIGDTGGSQLFMGRFWQPAKDVLEKYVFADDGTPVGEKVEDDSDE